VRIAINRHVVLSEHRERQSRSFDDLAHSLAVLQADIYHQPDGVFAEHAAARANAMLLRDRTQEDGRVTEDDWSRIAMLLDSSWTSLHDAVAR
jgi:predicted transcriptional regulator